MIEAGAAAPVIVVPYAANGIVQYGMAVFVLFWLGIWGAGWISVFNKLTGGEANLFLLFWLGAWTVGGFFVFYTLYRMLQPPIPEQLTLNAAGVTYDSGRPPFRNSDFYSGPNRRPDWSKVFPKRVRVQFDRAALDTLRLRQADMTNRLTIDVGAARFDLGSGASEVEREWLHRVLNAHYGLAKTEAAAEAAASV